MSPRSWGAALAAAARRAVAAAPAGPAVLAAALAALAGTATGAASGLPLVGPPAVPGVPGGLSLPGTPGTPASGEQVAVQLPPSVLFQVYDLRGGPVAARAPFPVAWSGARLASGNSLRISVRLETPGVRLSFQGRGPRGGTCGNGYLTAGAFIRVFDGFAGATAGGCDLLWQLDSLGAVKRSGTYPVALRWKIESIGILGGLGGMPGASGASGLPASSKAGVAATPGATAAPAAAGSAAGAAHGMPALRPSAPRSPPS